MESTNIDISCTTCEVGSCALYTLNINEIKRMESNSFHSLFGRGEILRKQGTPLSSIIYLRSGYVKEFIWHENSSDQVIQIIKPRSYIGLQGLCTNSTSIFSYQAITDVEVCLIEKDSFSELIRGNGSFAREILISLSHESISNHKRFLSLNKTQTFGKVAGLLVYLSEDVYESNSFNLHLKRAEMGQLVGSTRESVTRVLKSFHQEEIINLDHNSIEILNKERLDYIARSG